MSMRATVAGSSRLDETATVKGLVGWWGGGSCRFDSYLKYGLIDPRVAVERIKLDNTWQDPDYPTLTLEDLNYRHLSLFQQIPTGFYLVPLIILGSMILNDSWLVKFLGIIGMGGIFYLLYRIDQNTQFRAEKWMPPRECEFIDLKK